MGSTISAAIAVPLAAVLGGWRGALIALSVAACVVAVAWVVLERGGRPHVRPQRLLPRLPWRSGTAWLLVSIFALMGSAYYGLNAWLPDAYGERGWSDSSAGLLLAAMNLTAIATSFAVPWLSDRRGGRLPWLMAMGVVFTIGAVGLVAVPAAGYLWALMAGIAQGGMFALVMTLPLDLEKAPRPRRRPRRAHARGRLLRSQPSHPSFSAGCVTSRARSTPCSGSASAASSRRAIGLLRRRTVRRATGSAGRSVFRLRRRNPRASRSTLAPPDRCARRTRRPCGRRRSAGRWS